MSQDSTFTLPGPDPGLEKGPPRRPVTLHRSSGPAPSLGPPASAQPSLGGKSQPKTPSEPGPRPHLAIITEGARHPAPSRPQAPQAEQTGHSNADRWCSGTGQVLMGLCPPHPYYRSSSKNLELPHIIQQSLFRVFIQENWNHDLKKIFGPLCLFSPIHNNQTMGTTEIVHQ